MNYILIIVAILFVVVAIYKQQSFKGKFTNFNFYGEESREIAKTIIPSDEEIVFVSCGTNRDTENKSMFKASGMYNMTKTSSRDFKYFDYYIVAKTIEQIYFIPVKIKGTMKLYLEVNPKMKIEKYKLENTEEQIIKEKPNATLPTIDVKFIINNSESTHIVQFYGNSDEFDKQKAYKTIL